MASSAPRRSSLSRARERQNVAVGDCDQAKLSNPSEFQVEVDYQTEDGTAGVEDYVPTSGTLSFAAGTVSQDLVVEVLGDELKEANETLLLTLSNPVNGTIGGRVPVGTILDNEEMDFFTVTPCRLFDTRNEHTGGLQAGSTRVFDGIQCQSPGCWATLCSIPLTAKALAVTVTAVDPTSRGHLRLFPTGSVLPPTSTINFNAGVTRANNAVLTLGGTTHVTVYNGMSSGSTHVLIDVFGYFE